MHLRPSNDFAAAVADTNSCFGSTAVSNQKERHGSKAEEEEMEIST